MNTLSMSEHFSILASLESLWNENFNCVKCKNMYRRRPDYEKMSSKMRKIKGCYGPSEKLSYGVGPFKVKNCVGNYLNHQIFSFLTMWDCYKKGILPFEGPLMDQPCKAIEILDIIESVNNKKIMDEHEKAKQKEKKQPMRGR